MVEGGVISISFNGKGKSFPINERIFLVDFVGLKNTVEIFLYPCYFLLN